MTIRRCNRMLLGMGALLGLCATGCQSGWVAARPNGLLGAVAARRAERPSAEILRPRAIAMRTASSTAARKAAVTIEPPILRASAEEMPGGTVIASTWNALARGNETDPPTAIEFNVEPMAGAAPGSGEKLAAPRKMGEMVKGEVVSTHVVHGGNSHAMMHHPHHGVIHGADVPREGSKAALPPYVIEPPDILLVQLLRDPKRVPQPISGTFLVRSDGTILLGVYGSAHVAGKTLDEAKAEVVRVLRTRLEDYEITDPEGKKLKIKIEDEVVVDVEEYASKFCYLIADGGGNGAQVTRIAVNGSDTVLDIIGKLGGLPPQAAKKKIWLARPATGQLLPVDWAGMSQRALVATNYQVFPSDRIFVASDARIRFLSEVEKTIGPFERITGGVLLGASTKNALRGRTGNTGSGSGSGF